MAKALFHLSRVTKQYNGKEVLNIEELDIYEGEILGIMGPSGAGKTTLLKLLNFLIAPSSGTIQFDGHSFNGFLPLEQRRRITMLFQEPLLLSSTVEENILYGLKVRKMKIDRQLVNKVIERIGLSHLAKAQANTLSVGEKQRVALARAIVLSPEVLLLDEPTANLDPYNVALIEEMISSINREQGMTIVLVTHNVFQAKRLCHRTAFLLEGRFIEVGETNKLFSFPTDPRTLAFIRGEMVY